MRVSFNWSIETLQPPDQLMPGFLCFAKQIHQQSIDKGTKFSEDEMDEIFDNSFSANVRATFILWIGDLNKIIDSINIILNDLSELRKDKHAFGGDPVVRSEFLFQAFFGEFFRIREISRIFIKYLNKVEVLDNKNKRAFVKFYFTAFRWVYDLRNNIVHLGSNLKDYDVVLDFTFLSNLNEVEKEKFVSLIKRSNTRGNTIEIQCAIWMEIITSVMHQYVGFQKVLNETLADIIIAFEKIN